MILAVDASSVTAAAALCSGDGAVVRSDFLHNGLTHSETLLPMIRRFGRSSKNVSGSSG